MTLLAVGVLKNVIDWASRSYEGAESPLKGKFSAAVGAGGQGGAARAHVALRPILKELGCVHMPGPELQIQRWGAGPATFDANGSPTFALLFNGNAGISPESVTPVPPPVIAGDLISADQLKLLESVSSLPSLSTSQHLSD